MLEIREQQEILLLLVTKKSQCSEGDFESGANPEAVGSDWTNIGSPDTSEVVSS
jgi:hypothetical protein